jgi:signal peptidase I
MPLLRYRQRSANDLVRNQEIRAVRLHPARQLRRMLADLFQTAAYAIMIFLMISTFIGRFEIQQTSMEPTFHPGERVIVNQFSRVFATWMEPSVYAAQRGPVNSFSLARGQVVVFYDSQAKNNVPLIKRLIGLPGDTLEIHDGTILINGTPLDEPYLDGSYTTCTSVCGPLTLGDEQYFLMGDNRTVSRDSRDFGPIPGDQVIGRVVLRFWPLSSWEFFN